MQASASRNTKNPSLERHGHCLVLACVPLEKCGTLWSCRVASASSGRKPKGLVFCPLADFKQSTSTVLRIQRPCMQAEGSYTQKIVGLKWTQMLAPNLGTKQILPRWPRLSSQAPLWHCLDFYFLSFMQL